MAETLAQFTERLCNSVGCYYHKNPSRNAYSIKKYASTTPKHMGVFGWVGERKGMNSFRITSYKDLGDKAGVSHLASAPKTNQHWNSTGQTLFVKNGSNSDDYQKAVKALRAIMAAK